MVKKNILLFYVIFFALAAYSKNYTNSYEAAFTTNAGERVKVTNQHGDITIIPVASDTFEITVSISADIEILEDSAAFFNSIQFNLLKTGKTIYAETILTGNFNYPIPYEIDFIIYAPDSLVWDISNQFGEIKSTQPLFISRLNLEYATFVVPSLSTSNSDVTQCSIVQSILKTDSLGPCIMRSQNSDINIGFADEIVIRSEFSKLTFASLMQSSIFSYTDHIEIDLSEGLQLNSSYSDLNLNRPEGNLFLEMSFGKLSVQEISNSVLSLNVDLNKVASEMLVAENTDLLINAEMKYCDLKESEITTKLKRIKDGYVKTYSGKWGNVQSTKNNSILTIVSKFEDVELRILR